MIANNQLEKLRRFKSGNKKSVKQSTKRLLQYLLPDSKNRRSNCPSQSVLISTHSNTEVQIIVKEIRRQASGSLLMATGVQNVMRLFVSSYNL